MMEYQPHRKRELLLSTLSRLPQRDVRPSFPLRSQASHLHTHTHTHVCTHTHYIYHSPNKFLFKMKCASFSGKFTSEFSWIATVIVNPLLLCPLLPSCTPTMYLVFGRYFCTPHSAPSIKILFVHSSCTCEITTT